MESSSNASGAIKEKLTGRNVGIAVIIIALLASCWYFFYWKKTPEYSLGIIRESIQAHDVVTFEKHVDMDALLTRAFDDVVGASLEEDESIGDFSKSFAKGFAQVIKQPLVMSMKDAIKQFVEKGTVDEVAKETPKQEKQQFSPKELSKKTGASSSEYRGIAYSKKDGNIAVVGIKTYDKQIDKELIIELKMNALEDGTWRVSEISNLKEYMSKLTTYRREKLAELNKPTEEAIKSIISIGNISSRVASGDRWGFSRKLFVTVPVSFPGGEKPSSVHGTLTVRDSSGKLLLSNAITAQNSGNNNNQANIYYSFDLNQFMDGHKVIINQPQSIKIDVVLDQVKRADGTELKLFKQMPEA